MAYTTNACREFKEETDGTEVLCAWICFANNYRFPDEDRIYLKKGYTPQEYEEFLQKIDRNYDPG